LALGFLKLRCGEGGLDKLLAFCCKRRGFCPLCGARRFTQALDPLQPDLEHERPVENPGAKQQLFSESGERDSTY